MDQETQARRKSFDVDRRAHREQQVERLLQTVEKLCDLDGTKVNAPSDAQTSPVDLPCPIAICAKADTKPFWRPLENRSELNDGEKGTVLLDQDVFDRHLIRMFNAA